MNWNSVGLRFLYGSKFSSINSFGILIFLERFFDLSKIDGKNGKVIIKF